MKRHKGFSLLEVLMAFAIMAVAITIILRIFGSGVNNAIVSEEYSIAVQIAESLMARTGIETPLQIGELSGIEGGKYVWLVDISELASGAASQNSFQSQFQSSAQNQPPPPLFLVKVRVSWGDDENERRSIELSSLKSL
ncbi:MAG: prepilin-type N-terminal cleavage/methylation domain-containing protein [Methylococcales bacterium]|nr:prepilin-type N-terminal cleavage/methylation domain-containing protein [Methylococcales bacterium]